jgi:hypothetical protein
MSQRLFAFASASLLVGAMAAPARAQGVTATVSGTVKDAQSGVIPGATVTLISESRGTVSTPVVTNETGDFVFPNITGDTYTIRVAMDGFKTSERKGITVSAGIAYRSAPSRLKWARLQKPWWCPARRR